MTKMKKITALLLTMVMFFAFTSISAFAEEGGNTVDGIYHLTKIEEEWVEDDLGDSATLIIKDGTIAFESTYNGKKVEAFTNKYEDAINSSGGGYLWSLDHEYLTQDVPAYVYYVYFFSDTPQIGLCLSGYSGDVTLIDKPLYSYVKEDLSTEPQAVETSFMQKVITDSGQYEMYISGFLNATVVNGENVLTSKEIAQQEISIHVKNTVTGEVRVMNGSTIEGLTLNVSGGKVTSITLKGRVQTSKGTFERYTTTVNL